MALNPVTLAETLRPWHNAGLMFLLRDPEAEPFSMNAHAVVAEGAPLSEGFAGREKNASFTGEPLSPSSTVRQAPAISSETPSAPTFTHPERFSAGRHASPSSLSPLPAASVSSLPPPSARDFSPATSSVTSLPEEWAALLAKTPKAPVLWTYANLGDDLAGKGNAERSACLRELIGLLRLPRGTSCFWPVTMPRDGNPGTGKKGAAQDTEYFFYGLQQLEPKVVVFIGEAAQVLSGLGNQLTLPFTQCVEQGRLLLLLPDFTELLGTDRLTERSCAYLQSAFAAYPLLLKRRA